MSKITVLGGGGWAIALAMVLNDNGHNVTIWSAVNREVEALKTHRENKISLPGVIIPETVEITNDLKSAGRWKNLLWLLQPACPMSIIRETRIFSCIVRKERDKWLWKNRKASSP